MKIHPNLSRLWGKKIREAGMTKNQARKVLIENEKTQERVQEFIESPPAETNKKTSISNILKKLNVF